MYTRSGEVAAVIPADVIEVPDILLEEADEVGVLPDGLLG